MHPPSTAARDHGNKPKLINFDDSFFKKLRISQERPRESFKFSICQSARDRFSYIFQTERSVKDSGLLQSFQFTNEFPRKAR
jgi:hypothetical protein